mmetsp:Transcript_2869/g.4101  ORF Transcript_2869/g.4101 Transcript_2869/m.4101 type:complete len:131 (+) Transcript_2869:549-941(+)
MMDRTNPRLFDDFSPFVKIAILLNGGEHVFGRHLVLKGYGKQYNQSITGNTRPIVQIDGNVCGRKLDKAKTGWTDKQAAGFGGIFQLFAVNVVFDTVFRVWDFLERNRQEDNTGNDDDQDSDTNLDALDE